MIVTADLLEDYVARRFLDLFGGTEVLAPVEVDAPATALVETREALATVDRRLGDLDLADDVESELLGLRQDLRARLRTLRDAAPVAPEMRYEPTGEVVREAWASAGVDERRRMLGEWVDEVRVAKGQRGAHGLDTSRVELIRRSDHEPTAWEYK